MDNAIETLTDFLAPDANKTLAEKKAAAHKETLINKPPEETSGELPLKEGEQEFVLSGLIPNTIYYLSIQAVNAGGTTDSEILTIETLQDYPSRIRSISLSSSVKNALELDTFQTDIEPPERWGYWQATAKNDFGYTIFLISNGKLLGSSEIEDVLSKFAFTPYDSARPAFSVNHAETLQVGISPWVEGKISLTSGDIDKIFAEPGRDCPVCSNSVYLATPDESADILYLLANGKVNRTTAYLKDKYIKVFKT
jgi:hypothetical protein